MLESIGGVLQSKKSKEREAATSRDAKVFIERWLQERIRVDAVYCVDVVGSQAIIRVGSPVVHQEARLQEYNLQQAIEQTVGYTIKTMKIVTSY